MVKICRDKKIKRFKRAYGTRSAYYALSVFLEVYCDR